MSFVSSFLARFRPEKEAPVDPEIAAIIAELDEELAMEPQADFAVRDVGSTLRSFALLCERVALVGSHRRMVAEPRDIDVLYIPKRKAQVVTFFERAADEEANLQHEGTRWRCEIRGRAVDFIESATPDWGIDMIQFTGSREFHERFLRHAQRRGYEIRGGKPHKEAGDSYARWLTPAFAGWDEDKILTHLGLEDYLDPKSRA